MNKTQDIHVEHFPDRSLRRLLQDKEYVRGLVQIIAPEIEVLLDFSRITYKPRSFMRQHIQNDKELETMAQTTAEFLKEEGKEEGKVEGKQDAILKLLQIRFQNIPETLSSEIRNIHNIIHLDTLLEKAIKAQSLEEIDPQSS